MKANRKSLVVIGIAAFLSMSGAQVLATEMNDDAAPVKSGAGSLARCEDTIVDGVTITCPSGSKKARIIQIFNPAADKGTSVTSSCVCNATFTECDPDKNEDAASSHAKNDAKYAEEQKNASALPACKLGFIRSVPSEATLYGNNTTYCETIGGRRTCYTR